MPTAEHTRLQDFTDFIGRQLRPDPVSVRQNRNRVTYLSHVRREGVHRLSVHGIFLDADEEVWMLVSRFCRRADGRVRGALDEFVESVPRERWLDSTRVDRTPLRPVGDVHDLNAILVRALELGFNGTFPLDLPRIGWGRRGRRGRSLRLGTYDSDRHLVRINPVLDSIHIPEDYLAAIVHHELLHALHRPERGAGNQRIVHTRSFREAERRFPLFGWAQRFERDHLDRALRKSGR